MKETTKKEERRYEKYKETTKLFFLVKAISLG
jgi:hypothetical protein